MVKNEGFYIVDFTRPVLSLAMRGTAPNLHGDPPFSKWGPDGDPNFSEMGTKWGPSPAERGPKKRMFAKLIETSYFDEIKPL